METQINDGPGLGPRYTGQCTCGWTVWASHTRGGRPRYSETVTCFRCGRDCSRRDFPGFHLWWVRHSWRLAFKRWWHWRWRLVHIHLPNAWERLTDRRERAHQD